MTHTRTERRYWLPSAVLLTATLATSGGQPSGEARGLPAFVFVSAGQDHTCALAKDRIAYCWGRNDVGQLGTGKVDTAAHMLPQPIAGGRLFRSIASGARHTCGLTDGGEVFCWGSGQFGQLGQGLLKDSPIPVRGAGTHQFVSLTAGATHTCAVTRSGLAYCWGGNWHGQIGSGSLAGDPDAPCCRKTPTEVTGGLQFTDLSAGGLHNCGVTREGRALCWGSPQEGRLGMGDNEGRDEPAPIPVLGNMVFRTVSAGGWNTCGIATSGGTYCWGLGQQGQLGISPPPPSAYSPVQVAASLPFRQLSVSTYFVCALGADEGVYCWGSNQHGQLGDGSRDSRMLPAPIRGGQKFKLVSAGGNEFSGHACAVSTTDLVFCWGDNRHGQLGNGSTVASTSPVPVGRGTAR